MSITKTPLCTLAQIVANSGYREFKEQRLLSSNGYAHFKLHQFVHSERYQSILNAWMNPPPSATIGELYGFSVEQLEQDLDAITSYISSKRPFFTQEDLNLLYNWKRLSITLEYAYAQNRTDLCAPLNTLIGTCDAFFQQITPEEWLNGIISDTEVVNTLSDKKIAKIFLQECSKQKNRKYCVSMGSSELDKIGFFSPNGYYSLRRADFKTAVGSHKSMLEKNPGKIVYTATYAPRWGTKEKVVILSNLTDQTLSNREYRYHREKKLVREFHNLGQMRGKEIAPEPYDYFCMTGVKNMQFGFLVEAYYPLGNLYIWLRKPLTKEQKEDLIDSLIQKVCQVHALGTIHLDIKEENFVIYFNAETGKYEVRIIDWEVALPIDASFEEKTLPKGTALYNPPEYSRVCSAIKKQLPEEEEEELTEELVSLVALPSDVWSLGIILDRILYGEGVIVTIINCAQAGKKFSFDEIEATIATIDQQQINAYFADKTEPIDLMILGMLCIDPAKRLTMQQVQAEWKELRR